MHYSLKTLKSHFIDQLSKVYDQGEIESIFYILVEHIFGLNRIAFIMSEDRMLTNSEKESYEAMVLRIQNFEPIQYIVGEAYFMGEQFKVTPATLIPRTESVDLVNWIVDYISKMKGPIRVLDIGTGSGCLSIMISKLVPNAIVTAIDISGEALEVAKHNASEHHVSIDFKLIDVLDWKPTDDDKWDVIVSNPPYVRECEKDLMHANVLLHEPSSALFVSNDDPLLFYRRILQISQEILSYEGVVFFEINQYLSQEMLDLATPFFKFNHVRTDLYGNNRMMLSEVAARITHDEVPQ